MNPPPDIWYLIGLVESKDEGRGAFDKLVELGEPAVGPLIHLFKSEFIEEPLWSAVGSLLAVIGFASVLSLIEVTQDLGSEEHLRAEAVSILGYIGDRRAVEPLIDIVNDKGDNSYVRYCAIISLESLNDLRAVDALRSALMDDDKDVQKAAASALEQLGNKGV